MIGLLSSISYSVHLLTGIVVLLDQKYYIGYTVAKSRTNQSMKMGIQRIQSLIANGESSTIEFKTSTSQLQRAFETICGFLNGNGGSVLLGVNDRGTIVGQEISNKTKQDIAHEIGKLEPSSHITVNYIPIDKNHYVIELQVKTGLQAPYLYDGRAFQREQSVTKRMLQSKYDTLVAGRNQLNHSWESFIANDYNVELLESNLILSTVRKVVEDKRLPEIALRQDIVKILETLDLSKEGSLNNAAVVLFGTKFTPNYPQCQLKLARFKGVDKHEFIDSDLIYGNLFDLLDKAMLFIKRHLPVAAKIEPGKLERTEKPIVPYDAIREAFINSLCHRDYNIRGGSISLAIYDNRMEIYNNGGLPYGVTIEKIKAGFSQHRILLSQMFVTSVDLQKNGEEEYKKL